MSQPNDITVSQQSYAALVESEAILRTLAETTAAAIFIFQGPRLRYVNPAAAAITGYSQAELLGMSFWEIAHPDNQAAVKADGLARLHGQPAPAWYELRLLTKNGQERWVRTMLGRIEFQGQPAILGTAFDITGRKQAEEALQKSEAHLRAIIENTVQAFVLIDPAHRIQAFNRMACQLFNQELAVGDPMERLFAPPDLAQFRLYLGQVLAGEPVRLEQKMNLAGQDYWFRLDLNPVVVDQTRIIGACLSLCSIHTLKERVDSLTASEARLLSEIQSVLATTRALVSQLNLETVLEFIVTQAEYLMSADGAAVFMLGNDQYLEIATPGESGARVPAGTRLALANSLAEAALSSQQAQIYNQLASYHRAGSICALLPPGECGSLLIAPLIAEGEGLGVLLIWSRQEQRFSRNDSRLMGLFADQAALAIHTAHLHKQKRQLAIEQERHRLARDLHDSVSQSLHSIGLAAQTALRRLEAEEYRQLGEPLDYIQMLAGTSLAEVREQIFHLHPTSLGDIGLIKALARYGEVLSQRYELNIEFSSDPEPELSPRQREELYYLAREALWNAVKHADASRINLSLTVDDQQIVLTVADNGIGFEPELVGPGKTVGLRNMTERARLLGGAFDLASKPGEGTRITVRIPLNPL